MVAILGWATTTSNRVSAVEASQAAHEQRTKAESDATQYRNDPSEIRDRISRIEGYLKRLAE